MSEEIQSTQQTEDYSEVVRVRREKLAKLQSEGRDPYQITKFTRTAWTSDIKDDFENYENKDVVVAGRIMSKRDVG